MPRPRPALLACAVLAAVAAASPVWAQSRGDKPTRDFVQQAAQSDQYEIDAAQTAAAQSQTPAVVSFAQQMITDHTRLRANLQQATAQARLDPPPEGLSADQAAMLSALQAQRGADFDKAYANQQVLAHQQALVVTQQYTGTGREAAVRDAAKSAVAVIEQHRQMAQQLQASVGQP